MPVVVTVLAVEVVETLVLLVAVVAYDVVYILPVFAAGRGSSTE